MIAPKSICKSICRSISRRSISQLLPRAAVVLTLSVIGLGFAGCANMSDSMTTAFADPAKYDLYDCKQLEAERKSLATRAAELQGLIAKADTGVAGPLIGELAYRNDYIAVRGQARLADEAWRRNKCRDTPAAANTPTASAPPLAPDNSARPRAPRSGSGIY